LMVTNLVFLMIYLALRAWTKDGITRQIGLDDYFMSSTPDLVAAPALKFRIRIGYLSEGASVVHTFGRRRLIVDVRTNAPFRKRGRSVEMHP
jgi:hypothetical protein